MKNFKLLDFLYFTSYFTLIVYIIYLIYPVKIFHLREPIEVETKQVKRGETLIYAHKRTKNLNIPVEAYYTFVDGVIYTPNQSKISDAPTGYIETKVPVIVPMEVPPGRYTLRITLKGELPLFKKLTETYTTEEFEVL